MKKRIVYIALLMGLVLVFAACSRGNAETLPEVGDVIQLGGLDWRVMEVKDGKALVLSDKVLFKKAYMQQSNPFEGTAVSWEESDLRKYLNGDFYNDTFSAEEMRRIVETTVEVKDNPWYPPEYNPDIPWYSAPGIDTTDKVFLLSVEEVLKYFGDSRQIGDKPDGRSFMSDEYDEARIAMTEDGEAAWWWLRSPGLFFSACGANSSNATAVTVFGAVGIEGELVANEVGGVRPALWLKL